MSWWQEDCPSRGAALSHAHWRDCDPDKGGHPGLPGTVHRWDQCCHCEARAGQIPLPPKDDNTPVEPRAPKHHGVESPNTVVRRETSRRIPPRMKGEYLKLLRDGLTPADAESILALRHGLAPGEGQKQRWTLEELTRLEFVAHRVRDE